jgi:LPXTG-motif cell wall-anchored protein
VQLRGVATGTTSGGISYDFSLTQTLRPNANGIVTHTYQITNNAASAIDVGFLIEYDTMLNNDDRIPVYSLGADRGMFIDDSANYRVTFPTVSVASGGPDDWDAARYDTPFPSVFGADYTTPRLRGAPAVLGDVLLDSVDTGIFYRWNVATLAPGTSRSFAIDVALSPASDFPTIAAVDPTQQVASGDPFRTSLDWTDDDDASTTIYYSIDGGPEQVFGSVDSTPVPFELSSSGLSLGTHTITFWSIDPHGQHSQQNAVVTFEVIASSNTSPAPAAPGLPPTGAQTMALLSVAVGFILVGSAAFVIIRRRRH